MATWNIAGGQVVLAPFAPLDTQTQAALAADAAAVMRFPGQQDLLAGYHASPGPARTR